VLPRPVEPADADADAVCRQEDWNGGSRRQKK